MTEKADAVSAPQRVLLEEATMRAHGLVYPGFRRASAAKAAEKRGWLQYRGAGGYSITDEGRAALARASSKP